LKVVREGRDWIKGKKGGREGILSDDFYINHLNFKGDLLEIVRTTPTHYGSEQDDIETLKNTFSYQLGSE